MGSPYDGWAHACDVLVTRIGFEDLDALAKRDGIKDPALIGQMKAAVEEIVRKSASVYQRPVDNAH
ncbi:hypothetical protein [Paraburkholderia sp. SOS3]|uniref:hypothetical protein n=1 Tax=Paraburkholderia sp. SOS3 TaxID=1926494 RepID=UPI0012EBD822|nr:hypothetical protein [Paraburkholderia sp. SOS3]